MQLSQILQFIISGLTVGSVYGFTALGFTVIFNATGIINFAQGEFVMLGGLIAVYLYKALNLPLIVAGLAAIVIVAIIGSVFERLAIYPRRNAPIITLIIITIGGSMFFKGAAMHILGEDPMALPAFSGERSLAFFGAAIQPQAIWVIVITLATVVLLRVFYNATILGKAMRASSDNREAAKIVGINVSRLTLYSFAFSAAIGALGGIMITPIIMAVFSMGGMIGLKGFAAAIVGGLGNPIGSVLGGLVLGVLESLSVGIVSSGYKDAISLLILLLVLFIKPSGLFSFVKSEKI
jgi:branched-chain amino acid transport system permease protein